jgi:hypothetical protein
MKLQVMILYYSLKDNKVDCSWNVNIIVGFFVFDKLLISIIFPIFMFRLFRISKQSFIGEWSQHYYVALLATSITIIQVMKK